MNVLLNIAMLFYLRKAWYELQRHTVTNAAFAELFARMDKISNENVESLAGLIQDRSSNIFGMLESIYRRQNVTAAMIKDDRERLRKHVERVTELERIAKAVEEKFLENEQRQTDAG